MDHYTKSTQDWLDKRFKDVGNDGVYQAHQPIYGFRAGHCDPDIMGRYTITLSIMKMLSKLQFNNLVDIGGGEGYKAALARKLFGVEVKSCDLSREACEKAKSIYNIPAEPVDIHKLPFSDGEFDVVVCSETLEHVQDYQSATRELLRVCSKAVVITVPKESVEVVERNIRLNIPHGHIHALTLESFDFCRADVAEILSSRSSSKLSKPFRLMAEATRMDEGWGYPAAFTRVYNLFVPLFRLLIPQTIAQWIIRLDHYLANATPVYGDMLFVLLKDPSAYQENLRSSISAADVLNFKVAMAKLS